MPVPEPPAARVRTAPIQDKHKIIQHLDDIQRSLDDAHTDLNDVKKALEQRKHIETQPKEDQ